MKLLNNYFDQIQDLAENSSAEEVCGFLLRDGFGSLEMRQTKNIAPEGNKHTSWEISSTDYKDALSTNALFAMFHSHVGKDEEKFSKDDLDTSFAAVLPMFVYSVKTKKFNYFRPISAVPAFEHRSFIIGAQDCVSLVCDYYLTKFGADLPFIPRTPANIHDGYDIFSYSSDLTILETDCLKAGDILAISMHGDCRINHFAIYEGEDTILHQMIGKESGREVYTETWKRRTKKVMRLKIYQ